MTTDQSKNKAHITSKTKSKLDDRIALFSVYRHSISGSVSTVDHEKTFRDRGSGFVKILSYRLWVNQHIER